MLRSNALALAVVDDLGLTADPEFLGRGSFWKAIFRAPPDPANTSVNDARTATAEKLVSDTKVARMGLTFVIAVSVESATPRRAADLANAVAALHIERQDNLRMQTLNSVLETLEREQAELREIVDAQRSLKPDSIEYEMTVELYKSVSERLEEIRAQISTPLQRISVVSPAVPPVSPSFPQTKVILAAGFLAALTAAIVAAFVREQVVSGVSSVDELLWCGEFFDAVDLPEGDLQTNDRLTVADEIADAPLSPFSEAVRELRSTLDLKLNTTASGRRRTAHVVLVTSAEKAESKTTTALALARSFALAGRKTLLLDCDFRNPSLANQIGMQPRTGFLDYLQNPQDTHMPATFYGRDPASPASVVVGHTASFDATDGVLSSRPFSLVLEQARSVFDVVIIDGPPLLPFIDARILAEKADAIVLAVRWSHTNREKVSEALRRLSSSRPVLGALTRSEKPAASGYFRRLRAYSAAT